MAKDFTERLVDHRNVSLAPQTVSELPFHHGECSLNIAALVVVLQELLPPELEIVIHLLPRSAAVAPVVRRKGQIRDGSHGGNRFHVGPACVSLVRRDFGNLKILRCAANQSREHRRIVCVPPVNLDGGHNFCLGADHQMTFNPIVFFADGTVLVVKPASEAASSEAGRIHCEVRLHGLEGQAGLSDEALQDRSQVGILKVIGDAIEVRNLGDVSAPVGLSQVRHETALRNRAVDLECDVENGIGQRQARTAILRRSGHKARAQVMEQGLEFVLLVSLRFVVCTPCLRVGSPLRGSQGDALGHGRAAIGVALTSHHKACRENVLAIHPACFVVGASTACNLRHQVNSIRSLASLRRHNPDTTLLADRPGRRQFHSTLLSQVHNNLDYLSNILLVRYIFVKHEMYLDNILLGGILGAWHWSHSRKKATNVIAASMNGSREKARLASRASVRPASRRTGISRVNTSSNGSPDLSKGLAERRGFEPPTRGVRTRAWVLQTRPLPGSGISPLKAVSGEDVSKRLTPHLQCKNLLWPLLSGSLGRSYGINRRAVDARQNCGKQEFSSFLPRVFSFFRRFCDSFLPLFLRSLLCGCDLFLLRVNNSQRVQQLSRYVSQCFVRHCALNGFDPLITHEPTALIVDRS